ncbi:uncharacterized protein LOC110876986 [Helianthus annuus]|uniref:uncharacterized protein LOC110876986 n=1 Tax=Helianthus annuus TaxID=4232 RepID=UPI000B8F5407|nr:uncharacterized protein LOC110876986 [Helianthus annuus]
MVVIWTQLKKPGPSSGADQSFNGASDPFSIYRLLDQFNKNCDKLREVQIPSSSDKEAPSSHQGGCQFDLNNVASSKVSKGSVLGNSSEIFGDGGEVSGEASLVDREVEATVKLGNQLGMDLDAAGGLVRNIILGKALQESKCAPRSRFDLFKLWGGKNFEAEWVDSSGLSGGLICIWDPSILSCDGVVKENNFLIIKGRLKGSGQKVNIGNVYGPQDIQQKSGLLEYSMKDRKFTWQSSNGKKLSKIDRFLVCLEFFNSWPDACLRALPKLLSDHCPIVLVSKENNFGPKPFRVFDSWIGQSGFDETVRDAANSFVFEGLADLFLLKKFEHIRNRVKKWRDLMLKEEGEKESKAREELDELEILLENGSLSEEDEWILAENSKLIKEIELNKSKDIKQRSRVRWAKDGDENSNFFHSLVICRKASNLIHGLRINGNWCSKPSVIKKFVFQFFQDKFSEELVNRPEFSCDNFRKVNSAEEEFLVRDFSKEEIKSTISECGSDRAPGPDGLNFRFLKHFWIYLRTTSLVGAINKVVSKVLADRLKKVLGSIVSVNQSAFLKGKFILDGPLIINEVINWIKKKKKKAFLLKLDFEKAYDNVNWGFILSVMRQMGFPPLWCKWVFGILSSARAAVLVNGAPTFDFQCQKGMRQDKAVEVGAISGVQLPNGGPTLSHLFYADDALIIGEWSKENVLNMTGQIPFVYLGITVGVHMNRIANWRPVFEVFESRLSLWKASVLSIGGRVTLIKSVLGYKAPVGVLNKLESMIRKFLWGGSGGDNKLNWVVWDRVASPINCGGLGIRNLDSINRSLLLKWAWRYKTEKDSLWVKVISAVHNDRMSWDLLPIVASLGGVWKNITKVVACPIVAGDKLRNFMRGNVGDGFGICFWLDPWLCNNALKDCFPNLFRLEKDKKCLVRDRIVRPIQNPEARWEWKHPPDSNVELAEWLDLNLKLREVGLSEQKDKWSWLGDESGEFSVGFVKRLFDKDKDFSSRYVWEWRKWVSLKCNLFAWRAELDRLPTKVEL